MTHAIVVFLLGALFFACDSSEQAATGAGSREVLTGAEIQAASVSNAYEAVRRLRPNFIFGRYKRPVVYLDNLRYGGVSSLNTIDASIVEIIEFLKPIDATTRYGTGHTSGAILVTTRK